MADKQIVQIGNEKSSFSGTEMIEGQEAGGGSGSSFKASLLSVLNWARGYKVGFADYNHSGTVQNYTGGSGKSQVLNDAAGSFTLTEHLPTNVTSLWDAVNGQFDFSQLAIGDTLEIRFDIEFTTSANGQEILVELDLGVGSPGPYSLTVDWLAKKSIGVLPGIEYMGYYMGDTNTKDNPAELKVSSDENFSMVVKGWYITVNKK